MADSPQVFGIPRETIGQDQHRIIGAHVAIHGDAIETLRDRLFQDGLQRRCVDGRVRRDETQHRGVQWQRSRTPPVALMPG